MRLPIILICVFCYATRVEAAGSWFKIQSPLFTLIGDGSESRSKSLATGAEDFVRAMSARIPGAKLPDDLTIVIFSDDTFHDPFKPERHGAATNTAGYFLPGRALSFISVTTQSETQRTIYHELFHALVRQSRVDSFPTWASEGLAEFHSTFATGFGAVIPAHVTTLRTRSWIPLAELLSESKVSILDRPSDDQEVYYAESWALVHYLKSRSDSALPDLLKDAAEFDAANLESNLRRYVSELNSDAADPAGRQFRMTRTIDAIAATESEVATHLGNLLLELNRLDAAEEQFRRASEAEPVCPAAWTSLGALRLRQERFAEALLFLNRAVREDSKNHFAHFYYAAVLQSLSTNLQLSRDHLIKAIALAPSFTEAYNWLGYLTIALHDRYQDAESALTRAIEVEPGDEELRNTLVKVKAASALDMETSATRQQRESKRQIEHAFATLRVEEPEPVVARLDPPRTVENRAPKPRVVYPTFEGLLTMIDCRDGLMLVLRSNDKVVRFQTKTPIKVEFTSKVSNAANEAACGWVRPEQHVVVTYRKIANSTYLGEPLRIEYK